MSVNPAASESSAANSCGARMPPQQCFRPLDLACLYRIENGQMCAARLCDAFGGSCRTHRLMHAPEVVLPAHRIVRKAAIRTRRQSLVECGVDAEPLVSACSGLTLMKHRFMRSCRRAKGPATQDSGRFEGPGASTAVMRSCGASRHRIVAYSKMLGHSPALLHGQPLPFHLEKPSFPLRAFSVCVNVFPSNISTLKSFFGNKPTVGKNKYISVEWISPKLTNKQWKLRT